VWVDFGVGGPSVERLAEARQQKPRHQVAEHVQTGQAAQREAQRLVLTDLTERVGAVAKFVVVVFGAWEVAVVGELVLHKSLVTVLENGQVLENSQEHWD